MNWEPAEQVAKNDAGQYLALIGGRWEPVTQAAKNDAGQFLVMRSPAVEAKEPSLIQQAKQTARNLAAGAVRGAGSIGATLLAPVDIAKDAINGKGLSLESNRDRRAQMDAALQTMGADPESLVYKGGKLASEIAGTAGVGGVLAKGAQALGAAPALVQSINSGGLVANGAKGLSGLATRAAGGVATGGASAGLVDPESAGLGAAIGGALPGAVTVAGKTGAALGNALRGGPVAPEVKALANRAAELGIEVPADRLANSRVANALASGLNYVPFSGRAATEDAMNKQLAKALSRTFGQDSSNVTQALRDAKKTLGSAFDDTLKNNTIKFDDALLSDLAQVESKANRTLGKDAIRPINSQIDEIIAKGASGEIDGQAAYNIKRELDTISRGSGTEAQIAKELKVKLIDALNRSLGSDKAAEFSLARKQYGNMKEIGKLAKNGAEGDVSVARLANLKNPNNADLQELADIAAQFVKPREGQHGAMQRGFAAMGIGGTLGLPALAGTAAAGRLANTLLNTQAAKNAVLGNPGNQQLADMLRKYAPVGYRAVPVLATE